jgi:hypothetical protein
MTLKEKFEQFTYYSEGNNPMERQYQREDNAKECEKIAEEFAIGFALWKEAQVTQDDNGLYYGESRIAVSRKNPVDIYKLLEIYKKENGL